MRTGGLSGAYATPSGTEHPLSKTPPSRPYPLSHTLTPIQGGQQDRQHQVGAVKPLKLFKDGSPHWSALALGDTAAHVHDNNTQAHSRGRLSLSLGVSRINNQKLPFKPFGCGHSEFQLDIVGTYFNNTLTVIMLGLLLFIQQTL